MRTEKPSMSKRMKTGETGSLLDIQDGKMGQ